jgi:hypothetical protein
MPGPIVGAIAAGLGGSLISGLASSNAADAASDSSEAQMQLQADMFNRQDDLSGEMLGRDRKSIRKAFRQSNKLNELGRDKQLGYEGRNRSMFRNEMQGGSDRLRETGRKNINTLRHAQDKSLQPLKLGSRLGNNALRAYAENLGVGNAPGYSMELRVYRGDCRREQQHGQYLGQLRRAGPEPAPEPAELDHGRAVGPVKPDEFGGDELRQCGR